MSNCIEVFIQTTKVGSDIVCDQITETIIGIPGAQGIQGPTGPAGIGLLGAHAVSTAPDATTVSTGSIIYVTDEQGGTVLAFSDGTDWRRVTDRAIILAFAVGATLDVNFATGIYGSSPGANPANISLQSVTNLISCTRATSGWAERTDGTLVGFGANELRITDKGLLVEEAKTNHFLNSFSPATQVVTVSNATQYTISMKGSGSIALSGAATGAVTEAIPVTITTSGTALTCTISGAVTHAQVEEKNTPTSFIQTLGAPVTRAADVVMFSDRNWLSATQGTLLVETDDVGNTSDNARVLRSGSIEFRILQPNRIAMATLNAFHSASFDDPFKIAAAWDGAGSSLRTTGSSLITNSTALTADIAQFDLGKRHVHWSPFINGRIRSLTYWPTRKSDVELGTLVA